MSFQFPCYSLTPSWYHVARHIKLYKCIIFFCGKLLPKKTKKQKKQDQKKQKKTAKNKTTKQNKNKLKRKNNLKTRKYVCYIFFLDILKYVIKHDNCKY